jgi:transposase-like protein
MNIHKNARLTPQGRRLLVERITEAGWSVVQAAQAAGISVRQSYRWLARYRVEGAAGLGDRSSAPHRCPHCIPCDRVGEIEQLRRRRMSGPQIAGQLGMPVSTVGGVLRRLHLNRLAALDEKPAVARYERERPGELIHLDTKKLGRIAGVGHRIAGLVRSIGITASAGRPCTFASTTPRAWRTARSCRTRKRRAQSGFSTAHWRGSAVRASASSG